MKVKTKLNDHHINSQAKSLPLHRPHKREIHFNSSADDEDKEDLCSKVLCKSSSSSFSSPHRLMLFDGVTAIWSAHYSIVYIFILYWVAAFKAQIQINKIFNQITPLDEQQLKTALEMIRRRLRVCFLLLWFVDYTAANLSQCYINCDAF